MSETPLFKAAAQGDARRVRVLIDQGANPNETCTWQSPNREHEGVTPLFVASYKGHKEAVWLLVEHGAAVNQVNKAGMTPLRLSCKRGHLELVQLFSSHGADRGPRTAGGMLSQAEHEAKTAGHTRVVQWLQQTHTTPRM